jgi:hypothetical protein
VWSGEIRLVRRLRGARGELAERVTARGSGCRADRVVVLAGGVEARSPSSAERNRILAASQALAGPALSIYFVVPSDATFGAEHFGSQLEPPGKRPLLVEARFGQAQR